MNKITLRRLLTAGISSKEKAVVNAVIEYAEKNKHLRTHKIPISEFCIFAGLEKDMPTCHVVELMARARKVLVSLKVVASTGVQKKEILTGSAPVFNFILIAENCVSFEICRYLWDDIESLSVG